MLVMTYSRAIEQASFASDVPDAVPGSYVKLKTIYVYCSILGSLNTTQLVSPNAFILMIC